MGSLLLLPLRPAPTFQGAAGCVAVYAHLQCLKEIGLMAVTAAPTNSFRHQGQDQEQRRRMQNLEWEPLEELEYEEAPVGAGNVWAKLLEAGEHPGCSSPPCAEVSPRMLLPCLDGFQLGHRMSFSMRGVHASQQDSRTFHQEKITLDKIRSTGGQYLRSNRTLSCRYLVQSGKRTR